MIYPGFGNEMVGSLVVPTVGATMGKCGGGHAATKRAPSNLLRTLPNPIVSHYRLAETTGVGFSRVPLVCYLCHATLQLLLRLPKARSRTASTTALSVHDERSCFKNSRGRQILTH